LSKWLHKYNYPPCCILFLTEEFSGATYQSVGRRPNDWQDIVIYRFNNTLTSFTAQVDECR
ncbi:MAG: hypothetical protein JSV56_01705, partial [Methanomassiliicoccales archaeon]